jgi:hypothetical protein
MNLPPYVDFLVTNQELVLAKQNGRLVLNSYV